MVLNVGAGGLTRIVPTVGNGWLRNRLGRGTKNHFATVVAKVGRHRQGNAKSLPKELLCGLFAQVDTECHALRFSKIAAFLNAHATVLPLAGLIGGNDLDPVAIAGSH